MFSKACELGIKAVLYIATQSMEGVRVKTADIVRHSNLPLAYTAKILGSLTNHNIVKSQTGPKGGFYIQVNRMHEIRLSEIVEAIDGDSLFTGCGLGLPACNHLQPCPMHHKFVTIRSEMKNMMNHTTLYELALGLKSGKTVLKR